jgi:23S rRNA (uridine2552-2'-O)-methyltransferase
MSRRSGSSQRWKRRQQRDPYVDRAAREGWRSRAVFKLEQIQSREGVLRKGIVCVDLGASPGGWSQYAARIVRPGGRVIALDLLPMEPLPGVEFLTGDFTEAQTRERLAASIGGDGADLVMSDMAPNISGNRAIDQPRSMQLAEEALELAHDVLRPGGDFLVKLFQGEGFEPFVAAVRTEFRTVRLIKPKASRAASREIYLLARNYAM